MLLQLQEFSRKMSSLELSSIKTFNSKIWHLVTLFAFVFAFVSGTTGYQGLPWSDQQPRALFLWTTPAQALLQLLGRPSLSCSLGLSCSRTSPLLRPYCPPLRGSCIVDPYCPPLRDSCIVDPTTHPYVAVVLCIPFAPTSPLRAGCISGSFARILLLRPYCPPLRGSCIVDPIRPYLTPTCRLYSGLLRKDIASTSLLTTSTWQLYCPYCPPLRGSCIVDPIRPYLTPTCRLYSGLLRKDIASSIISQNYCSFSSTWVQLLHSRRLFKTYPRASKPGLYRPSCLKVRTVLRASTRLL